MTKEELFKKYSIDDSHKKWESIDSWMSIEIYRIMHNGNLPPKDDASTKWVLDFLDKSKSDPHWWAKNVMNRKDFGSLYLTSKRMVRMLAEGILLEVYGLKGVYDGPRREGYTPPKKVEISNENGNKLIS